MGFLSKVLGGGRSSGGSVFAGDQFTDLFNRAKGASLDTSGNEFAGQFNDPAFAGFGQLLGGQALGQEDLLSILSGQRQNEALSGEIQAGLGDISRNFNENILPGINTGSALSGTSGGSRQGIAQGLAAGQANQQASDFTNRLRSQNFQSGLNAQLGAAGQLGQRFSTQQQGISSALGLAPSLQNLGFNSQFGNLNALKGILGNPTVLGGGSSNQRGLTQGFGDVFGGGGGGGGGAANLFGSDRRIKKDIKRVGSTLGGQPTYTFKYIWGDETHFGVMAQESPENAVVMHPSGFLMVDYNKIR